MVKVFLLMQQLYLQMVALEVMKPVVELVVLVAQAVEQVLP